MNQVELRNKILTIANGIKVVNQATSGSVYERLNTAELRYGIVNVDFMSVTRNENTVTYSVILYYADRLTETGDNEDHIQDDGVYALTKILNELVECDEVVSVGEYNTFNLFNQQFVDRLAGCYVRANIEVLYDLGCRE